MTLKVDGYLKHQISVNIGYSKPLEYIAVSFLTKLRIYRHEERTGRPKLMSAIDDYDEVLVFLLACDFISKIHSSNLVDLLIYPRFNVFFINWIDFSWELVGDLLTVNLISRQHFPRTPCSLLIQTNPKPSEVTNDSMCHWLATACIHWSLTLGTPFLIESH